MLFQTCFLNQFWDDFEIPQGDHSSISANIAAAAEAFAAADFSGGNLGLPGQTVRLPGQTLRLPGLTLRLPGLKSGMRPGAP